MTGWILIAGYGSIGRRHFRNLKELGISDVRLLRSGRTPAPGFETPSGTQTYTDLESALQDQPAVVVVATPTALHGETVRAALHAGACVLLEKPVCSDLEEARDLLTHEGSSNLCSMAYCFRYHPLYRRLYEIVRDGRLGRVFHATTWQANYLPHWHPWEDYRTGYAGRSDLGGGVVRTLDHDLDMLRWVLGQPEEVFASVGSISGIDVEVEDTADMIFRFRDAVQAHAHVTFGSPAYRRGMTVTGDRAVATLDWNARTVSVGDGKETVIDTHLPADFDLNTTYVAMLRDALDGFSADEPRAAVPLTDGIGALEMAEAALTSSGLRRAVRIDRATSANGTYRRALQT